MVLYEMLPDAPDGSKPSLPMVLGALGVPKMAKMIRFREHIEWADKYGALPMVAVFLMERVGKNNLSSSNYLQGISHVHQHEIRHSVRRSWCCHGLVFKGRQNRQLGWAGCRCLDRGVLWYLLRPHQCD